ncbi:Oligopeptide transport system permease protein AppC [Bosea sp. 62]|uniref:ABC transporter permease n=1 Tax=unclassified Bosea (in: a-proteobacteria) TaxID=2653178 RepID=UPI001256A8C6|nr:MULTISPECIES: ABC transporter permease [unclassified Bosea (in: a-proteobacteria)]CAD5251549.1 Oligopeptide transport system permease protein AppC [Bosea sp. 21B]CAD5261878.1 Oligopeptide transport system permease protein AppC [Bosea sp. 7B]CAD5272804.1 Oligopeptide transport system permease protein AppC [Bosea sp. 46]VVT43534.1 Oligopeptide transport system permease protein AppC [Bosea sp. EC-HK365B]VXB24605.1 Oligopeptide transport system permease protein AppC [Bosea sp. 29B]
MSSLRKALDGLDWSGWLGAGIVGLIVLAAIFAPLIAPYDPLALNIEDRLAAPDLRHWLGTDQGGRDVLSRILFGARASLSVGVGAVLIGALIGVSAGVVAAYKGGLGEQVVMRIVDGVASIPLLVWAIAIVGILGVGPLPVGPLLLPNEVKIVVLVGCLFSPVFARVTYAVARRIASADYVRARFLQGASHWQIVSGDVLPNCLSPIIVQGTLLVAIGIVIEASISFVGLGVQPPQPSWGTMLSDARSAIYSGEWWLPVFPGLAISLTVIGFNLLGDAVRELFDPRSEARTLVA